VLFSLKRNPARADGWLARVANRRNPNIAAELNQMPTRQALTIIGHTIAGGLRDPDAAALFRLVATEAHRFPELAAKMRSHSKARIGNWVANYLCEQSCRGNLILREPDWAAVLFVQMICAELHEYLLFGPSDGMSKLDVDWHVSQVIDIFLLGAAPRELGLNERPTEFIAGDTTSARWVISKCRLIRNMLIAVKKYCGGRPTKELMTK
jgi:hypothetical protein